MSSDDSKIRCIVADDEPLAAALISSYVKRTPFLELVGEASSSEEVLAMTSDRSIDLIFLDIHIPGLTGMQLAHVLPQNIRIIFTTAYSEYALEGYRVNAVDYLLKPISYDEFLQAALRANEEIGLRRAASDTNVSASYITVKSEYRLVRVPLSEIDYIEGLKDYVKIYTTGNERPVLSLMSIKSLEATLPSGTFMRVHRSFIVNLDRVRLVERTGIIMGGRCIPISESYRKAFFDRIS